jgi:HK97 family phage prohead protease
MKTMEYKGCVSEIKDVTEKGTVTFYAAVFGNRDLGNDIIDQGAFKKTLMENAKTIRHFKHHDQWQMPGVIQDIKEDNYGLLVQSKLILNTQLGRETYEEYRAMVEAGKSMDHSIGFRAIKSEPYTENEEEIRRLKEIRLFEVSTLTAFGMNPLAQTVGVKSFEELDLTTLLTEEKYYKALLSCRFTDAKLESIEGLYKHLQSLIASRSVNTPNVEPIDAKEFINQIKFF